MNKTQSIAILKTVLFIVLCAFALIGIWFSFYQCQIAQATKKVKAIEASRTYDKDMAWNLPNGEPIFMVNPANSITLFFFEGFRGQIGAGQYRDWFQELHTKYKINIVAPIIGVQGYPFELRNRQWHYIEDMRTALQIYESYTASIPATHKVFVASMSFGALANATIAAKANRKPDGIIFISPLNKGLDYRSQNPIVAWLSTQVEWLRFILPYQMRGRHKARATLWDIVNDDMNRAVFSKYGEGMVNPEENLAQAAMVAQARNFLQDTLLPQITSIPYLVLAGDSDLYFTQEGFAEFASILSKKNTGKLLTLTATGHMVLLDNGAAEAKAAILGMMGLY